ncbi:ribulose-phosphate 3-epimerase [Salipaludibacillus agaradhaerens]|uniref:ribulose-phosphate 3-epimerase n=1 Tax=Salipaludibacillus agaradhaerens TaxID=76935 RepID=UPI000996EB7E|nr:ribulose-phosphate 3-epimerase [Salipaludibacillus agaradhaerens]
MTDQTLKLAPSILNTDFSLIKKTLEETEAGGAHMVHFDVMDGHFVPDITFGPAFVASLRPLTSLLFDVHLMVENPENHIPQFIEAGADMITCHAEVCPHLYRTIQTIKASGVKAGVVLNPATPLYVLDGILPELDMVLLMSVNPGFGGQQFIPSVLEKIGRLREEIIKSGREIDIEVDGGITHDNVKGITNAGANIIVAGTAIYSHEDIKSTICDFKKRMGIVV